MEKIDYKKKLKNFYKSSIKKVAIVNVPKMNFLMLDGKGDPNTSKKFHDAISVLFPLSYALKFMIKKGKSAIDYGVLPLEGLWWADDMSTFSTENKNGWKWTLMIMQPELITTQLVKKAIEQVQKKKDSLLLQEVRFESFDEGKTAQIMHVGPFSEEGPTIKKLHTFIKENGYKKRDEHHEIYLSDIRRAAPKNWKTIIRQPI